MNPWPFGFRMVRDRVRVRVLFLFFLSFFFNLLITIIQSNHDQNLEEMKNLNCTFHIRHNDFPEINAFESQLLASAFG